MIRVRRRLLFSVGEWLDDMGSRASVSGQERLKTDRLTDQTGKVQQ